MKSASVRIESGSGDLCRLHWAPWCLIDDQGESMILLDLSKRGLQGRAVRIQSDREGIRRAIQHHDFPKPDVLKVLIANGFVHDSLPPCSICACKLRTGHYALGRLTVEVLRPGKLDLQGEAFDSILHWAEGAQIASARVRLIYTDWHGDCSADAAACISRLAPRIMAAGICSRESLQWELVLRSHPESSQLLSLLEGGPEGHRIRVVAEVGSFSAVSSEQGDERLEDVVASVTRAGFEAKVIMVACNSDADLVARAMGWSKINDGAEIEILPAAAGTYRGQVLRSHLETWEDYVQLLDAMSQLSEVMSSTIRFWSPWRDILMSASVPVEERQRWTVARSQSFVGPLGEIALSHDHYAAGTAMGVDNEPSDADGRPDCDNCGVEFLCNRFSSVRTDFLRRFGMIAQAGRLETYECKLRKQVISDLLGDLHHELPDLRTVRIEHHAVYADGVLSLSTPVTDGIEN